MDVIFSVAVLNTKVAVDKYLTVVLDGNRVRLPATHDRIDGLKELQAMRKTLHERIDAIIDHAVDTHFEIVEKKGIETVKVFDCFGQEPRMIEVRLSELLGKHK